MHTFQNRPMVLGGGTSVFRARIRPELSSVRARLSADPRSTQILVIDDNACVREVIGELLGMEGYRVHVATDGAEALDFIDRTVPALAVLDMLMPVLDGWGFARGLEERHVRLPILAMTACENDGRWADEIGAAGWLPKPFDLDELIDVVKVLLGTQVEDLVAGEHPARICSSMSPPAWRRV